MRKEETNILGWLAAEGVRGLLLHTNYEQRFILILQLLISPCFQPFLADR